MKSPRSIVTPTLAGTGQKDGGKSFWKQILPESDIHYTTPLGKRATMSFDRQYLTDLAESFKSKFLDSTQFVLADADNKHTMLPERVRAEVTEMCLADQLPANVQNDGKGLWAKIKFPTKEAAQLVRDNPKLGVSARIRENIPTASGSVVPRGIIHVLGTLHPQVSGMSPWQPIDLSDSNDELIDLSNESFEKEGKVAKKAAKQTPIKDRKLSSFTEAEIKAFTEEELDTFLSTFTPEDETDSDSNVDDDAADTDTDDDDDADNSDDDSDDDSNDDGNDSTSQQLAGAALSTKQKNNIDLSNAAIQSATARANEALRRMAEAEWKEFKSKKLAAGVPANLLDLAEPILNRADPMVIDLSADGGEDINVSEFAIALLDAAEGMVDLSNEEGHSGGYSGNGSEADPDEAALKAWAEQY
jgi:hypothetical protein